MTIYECMSREDREAMNADLANAEPGTELDPLDLIEGVLLDAGFEEVASEHVEQKRWGPVWLKVYRDGQGRYVAWTEYDTDQALWFEEWSTHVELTQGDSWVTTGTEE
jgi:hypothetical protein